MHGSVTQPRYPTHSWLEGPSLLLSHRGQLYEIAVPAAAAQEGKTGSTLNSHRLISWAGGAHGPEAQNRLVDNLFEAYFTQVQAAALRLWPGLRCCGR